MHGYKANDKNTNESASFSFGKCFNFRNERPTKAKIPNQYVDSSVCKSPKKQEPSLQFRQKLNRQQEIYSPIYFFGSRFLAEHAQELYPLPFDDTPLFQ